MISASNFVQTASESGSDTGGVLGIVVRILFICVELAIVAGIAAAIWKVHTKAGQPGWAAFVPLYNVIVLSKITGRAWWWLLVPFLNMAYLVMTPFDVAKSFGKSGGFGVGLLLLPFVFYPILAFGDSSYQGPAVRA